MIACPGCGANLLFDIASQQMKCSYCESSYDPYQFDSMQKDASREKVYDAWIYSCPSCGARLMTTDETDAEAFCPYCGMELEEDFAFCPRCGKQLPDNQ